MTNFSEKRLMNNLKYYFSREPFNLDSLRSYLVRMLEDPIYLYDDWCGGNSFTDDLIEIWESFTKKQKKYIHDIFTKYIESTYKKTTNIKQTANSISDIICIAFEIDDKELLKKCVKFDKEYTDEIDNLYKENIHWIEYAEFLELRSYSTNTPLVEYLVSNTKSK